MILRHPWFLALVLLTPLLAYLRYARRRQPTAGYSDGDRLAKIQPSWAVLAQPLLPVLYIIGLLAMIVALSRPQVGLAESRIRAEVVDIVLLADVSTSMRAEDFSDTRLGRRMNRLEAAQEVMRRFVRARVHDRLGLIAFAAMPYSMSPLTLDHDWVLQQIERLKTGMVEDGTAIGDAIASAVNRLRDSKAKSKVVILLTDGINNRGQLSPLNAAQLAKAVGVKIYTVGAGKSGLVPYPVQDFFGRSTYQYVESEVDEGTLRQIAEITGGRYFRATDWASLKATYDEIDRLEKTEVNLDQYTRFEERFAPWLTIGLAALVLEKLLSLTRLGRLP
jgi:Ca-activated chloride channel family protein